MSHHAAQSRSDPTADAAAQSARMRATIGKAVTLGPDFLRGAIDADAMAHHMVSAVEGYLDGEKAAGRDIAPHGAEAQELVQALKELETCGSGYLAGRCDAACVARTITYMVQEYGVH